MNRSVPNNKMVRSLLQAVLLLEDEQEARRFLRDLLTEQEIIEFAKRWEAVQLLDRGASYAHIERRTGLSSTTIARISKWLHHGCGGYQSMLKKFNEQ